ncbi:MAG TPA: hypothetical protein VHY20_06605 [Pirellulales bacterium]|nr:hypothetical protein [Pirellulales bacterium]
MKATRKPKNKDAALLGLGLDGDDGHTRLTRGKNFVLYGGSEETHGRMQETAVKLNEHLDRKGKRLEDVPPRELSQILREIVE